MQIWYGQGQSSLNVELASRKYGTVAPYLGVEDRFCNNQLFARLPWKATDIIVESHLHPKRICHKIFWDILSYAFFINHLFIIHSFVAPVYPSPWKDVRISRCTKLRLISFYLFLLEFHSIYNPDFVLIKKSYWSVCKHTYITLSEMRPASPQCKASFYSIRWQNYPFLSSISGSNSLDSIFL